jgi:hypothetical protein
VLLDKIGFGVVEVVEAGVGSGTCGGEETEFADHWAVSVMLRVPTV